MKQNELSNSFILVADVGGSHITTAICDVSTFTILPGSMARKEFSSKANAVLILDAWSDSFKIR